MQARLLRALDFTGGAIGATHMVTHSLHDCFGHPMVVHAPAHGWPADRQVAATLERCCPTEQIDCTLVISETIRDEALSPLVDAAGHDRCAVCA
ncbi:MAG: hypothetical protein R2854_15555 [Caldilineaceae bacterium]